MKSLGDIFRHLAHQDQDRAYDDAPQPAVYYSQRHHHEQQPEIMLLSQKRDEHSPQTHSPQAPPSRQEIKDYLGQLADEYHLPRRLVYGVADAESSYNPTLISNNYKRDSHHNIVNDAHGNPIITSKDYGLMQINSPRIGHDVVKDPNGHRFKIEANVTHDWKPNARAGVAIIKHAHDLVSMSEGPGASSEDIALGTYSYYNHDHRWHKFIDRDKHGVPKDGPVRNFYNRYRNTPDR